MRETSPGGLRERLNAQTGSIAWPELERHFARGAVVAVGSHLDLIEVAVAVARDDAAAVREWTASGALVRATDDHARRWVAAGPDARFRAVVVAPWVLVQEMPGD